MRLLFVARAINGMAGGVERMVIALGNEMAMRGHGVGLLTWDRADAQAFYHISPSIRWYKLDLGDAMVKAGVLLRLQRAIATRRIVAKFRPDVITAFQSGTFKALSLYCTGMRLPIVATERNAPTLYEHISAGEKGRQEAFRSFRMAQFLVVQCETYRDMHPPYLQQKLIVIPNPVYPAKAQAAPHVPDAAGRFSLLAVGRLCYQKNFESLIEAFARIKPYFAAWDMCIVGEGEYRRKLERLIREKNCSMRISLPGVTKDPFSYYVASHLFCLPSRWEGFPNTLAEAAAHGLPAVGYAGCAGVDVLIEHEKTGLLAAGNGDPETLSTALGTLMEDSEKRRFMGESAHFAMARYDPKIIMDRWEEIFWRAAV